MTTANDLDLKGNFQTHPFAELLTEISVAKFSGSLRVARDDHKLIVYFDDGSLIFAVSNARKFRLFDILVRENRVDKEILGKTPNFANDIEFANALRENGMLTEDQVSEVFAKQVEGIIAEALAWPDGQWTFSPLARLRSGIRTAPKVHSLLAEHARSLSQEAIAFRFKSLHEMFELVPDMTTDLELEPQEAFVLSRLSSTPQTVTDILAISGLGESEALKTLYTLWFAGMLIRKEWNPAFSEFRITRIRTANVTMTKPAVDLAKPKAEPEPETPPTPVAIEEEPEPEIKEISLDEYLERVEKAESHYEILGIVPDSKLPEIRASYFTLAKMFHPDRFHRAEAAILRQVENAFSKLAQAHEALRDPQTRTAYDNQMRRDANDRKARGDTPIQVNVQANQLPAERAVREFEHGLSLLSDGDFDEALPFLARAVHLAPDVARYHAFHGKALSFAENGRHKAEGEMQAAIRLEPSNAVYRMMLAEFLVDLKLFKRAEGELTRLLAIAPDNKEAQSLLDSVRQK